MSMCADCPDLDNPVERPADPIWKPRPVCCRDELIELRREGLELDATDGVDEVRKNLDRRAAREAEALVRASKEYGTRAERRARAAQVRRESKPRAGRITAKRRDELHATIRAGDDLDQLAERFGLARSTIDRHVQLAQADQ
jgi:hypothetical protein